MKTIKTIVNIILGLGCCFIVNEGDDLTPNFVAIACFALLVVLNADKATIEKYQK